MAINGNLPLWLERVLLPGAWDVTFGKGETVSAHWAEHYYQHGYGATVAEAMDLFHEDLMRTAGFETDYRSTIGPVALAAALPHPYSHELIFPHLKANQMVKYRTPSGSVTDVPADWGVPTEPGWSRVSDLGFGYGQDPTTRGSTGYTYDPEFSAITGDHPAADIYIKDYARKPTLEEKVMPMNGTASVTALDFGYGAGAYSIPSMASLDVMDRPRRAASQRVSVGKNIPRSKTMAKLNKYMHEWRKEIRQITGRLGGFYGPARPSTRTSGRRRSVGRHRHKINSFDYQRQGRTVHSHRVKSRRR